MLRLLIGLSAAVSGLLTLGLVAPGLAAAASGSANSVACPTAGGCTAVGTYVEADGAQEGLLLSQVGGRWGPDQIAALPAGAAANPTVVLNDLWCSAGPDCIAVGDYDDGAGDQLAMVLTEHNGVWAVGEKVALPANAIGGGSQLAELNAVWCSSAADCVAVGDYTDANGNQQGLSVLEQNGKWSAGTETPLPATAATDPQATLTAIDCASISSCDVEGVFNDQGGNQEGVILVGAAPNWGDGEAVLPSDAAQAAQQVQLNSIGCGAASDCIGAGAFIDTSGNEQPLILIADGDDFSTLQASLPANVDTASNPDAQLTSVWCSSAGNCTVVGDYDDSNSDQQGLVLTQSGGNWSQGQELALPSGAAANPQVTLNALWCSGPGDCIAAGGYEDTAGAELPLLTSQSNGIWAPGGSLTLPAGAPDGGTQTAALASIACASAGSCATVGEFTNAAGSAEPLLAASTSGVFGASVVPATPPSAAQLKILLKPLTEVPTKTTLTQIARHGRVFHYADTEPGKLALTWYHGATVVARSGTVNIAKQETVSLTLKLTAAGRRIAAGAARSAAVLEAKVSFTPQGSATVTVSRRFKLR